MTEQSLIVSLSAALVWVALVWAAIATLAWAVKSRELKMAEKNIETSIRHSKKLSADIKNRIEEIAKLKRLNDEYRSKLTAIAREAEHE